MMTEARLAALLSPDQFRAWLVKQPAEASFPQTSMTHCAIAQYLHSIPDVESVWVDLDRAGVDGVSANLQPGLREVSRMGSPAFPSTRDEILTVLGGALVHPLS